MSQWQKDHISRVCEKGYADSRVFPEMPVNSGDHKRSDPSISMSNIFTRIDPIMSTEVVSIIPCLSNQTPIRPGIMKPTLRTSENDGDSTSGKI